MTSFLRIKRKDSFIYGNELELNTYLFKNGKKLPPSYIDFAKTLGYGLLCDLFIIYIPMSDYPDSLSIQTNYIKGAIAYSIHENLIDYEPDGNEELLKRSIPFAMSENGQYLFWDIESDQNGEFPIYVLGSKMGAVMYGAANLYEFIDNCIDPVKVKKMLGPGYNVLPLKFEPIKPIS